MNNERRINQLENLLREMTKKRDNLLAELKESQIIRGLKQKKIVRLTEEISILKKDN